MQPSIPRGLRDVLPLEAADRRALAERCRGTFESWGYGQISTPSFEYFDLLALEAGEEISREMFRFVDSDGRLVALRPEMTTPIARAVAQRMQSERLPLRLFYVEKVFREQPARLGEQREFEQAGVELLGARGPAADMEVVALAAEMLSGAGLAEFQIGIGHVGVFRILLEQLGADTKHRRAAEELATARNLVGLGRLLEQISPEARNSVGAAVNARGGPEAIETLRAIVEEGEGRRLLDEMAETYRLLEAYGLSGKVMLDFGIIRNFDYYTGLVLEAYTPGLGAPIATGGRYDDLLAEFGAAMPAAGFAAGLERLHLAIAKQGAKEPAPEAALLVGWEAEPTAALRVAKQIRAAGRAASVTLEPVGVDRLRQGPREELGQQAGPGPEQGRGRRRQRVAAALFVTSEGRLILVGPEEERPVAGVAELLKELETE
ncbi:MAG: ATP phosphoribosyltransferase regulatory subunit [Actinobacteria bacterium]|nr:MAG: ATP phosphoribosyltransferase regulatory subunit [Actinomycetota bacterium]